MGVAVDMHPESFSADQALAFIDQYLHLLAQLTAFPETALTSHSLVTDSARRVLPDPAQNLLETEQRDVASLIRDWARKTPNAIALRYAGRTWSYRELCEQAETVATELRRLGLRPGDVVALEGPRSPGIVIAMSATILCGGVFVTLDPALPVARRELMLSEAGARFVCCIESSVGAPGASHGSKRITLRLSADLSGLKDLPSATGSFEAHRLQGDDPAYIFFTSGTTGVPKAVLGCHKGLSHFVQWQAQCFGIQTSARVSQLIGLSFGPLLRDIFLPLTSGATLCIPEEADLLNPLRWCAREGVTAVHTTPTVMMSWLSMAATEFTPVSIEWVFVSGEPLADNVVRAWRDRFPACGRIVNLYGQTETTLAKCYYVVPLPVEPGLQPVGASLPGSQVLVLSPKGLQCGVGELGEFAVRTPYRSLGYLNLPEETRRRFLQNPWRNDARDLLYFTGDLGRYRPDGMLELTGRLDDQVKIRGVRVEPAEVSAVLAGIAGVQQNVVMARRREPGDEVLLVAYVVALDGAALSPSGLRAQLAKPAAVGHGARRFRDARRTAEVAQRQDRPRIVADASTGNDDRREACRTSRPAGTGDLGSLE